MDIETEEVELITSIVGGGEDQLLKVHKFVNGNLPILVISGTAYGSNGCATLYRVLEKVYGNSFAINGHIFRSSYIYQPLPDLEQQLRDASLIFIHDEYSPIPSLEILTWLRSTFTNIDYSVVIVTRDIDSHSLNEIGVDESSVIRLPFTYVRNPQQPHERQDRFDWAHTLINDPEFKNTIVGYLNEVYNKRLIKFN
jgi:hypothetical protein